jgi:hypothetical protein
MLEEIVRALACLVGKKHKEKSNVYPSDSREASIKTARLW